MRVKRLHPDRVPDARRQSPGNSLPPAWPAASTGTASGIRGLDRRS